MGKDIDTEQLRQGLAVGAIGFGVVATLVPGVFTGVYGLGQDPSLKVMTRLWGTRTTVLGVSSLLLDESGQRQLMRLLTGLNVADTLLIARAKDVPARAKVLGVLSTTAFGAGFAYLAAKG